AASVRPEPGSNSPLNDSHPDPKARENKPPSHRASMTVNRQQALLGRRTRHDGGSTYINALAFNTLLSSQETRAHHGRKTTHRRGTLATILRVLPGVNSAPKNFAGSWDFPYHQNTNLPGYAARAWLRTTTSWWLPGSRRAFRRSVPPGQQEH